MRDDENAASSRSSAAATSATLAPSSLAVQSSFGSRSRLGLMTASAARTMRARRAVVLLELDDFGLRESRAGSRGCCARRRRASGRCSGRRRRPRRGSGGFERAAARGGTGCGSCPGTRRPARSGSDVAGLRLRAMSDSAMRMTRRMRSSKSTALAAFRCCLVALVELDHLVVGPVARFISSGPRPSCFSLWMRESTMRGG